LLKVGVSNGAISLQYIHSRSDLSVLIGHPQQQQRHPDLEGLFLAARRDAAGRSLLRAR
jgi:hypothetical protein